ncbi:MAG: Uma2 family endonuclease [Thermomicrobiales bacterium]|nr:Uma2 family endonuclease [Thermomicrobiales bacterium]
MALPATRHSQPHLLQALTYDDLRAMPDDGNRYELIFGEIVMSPSPNTRHQHVLGELFTRMKAFAHERQLGRVYIAPLDVRLSLNNVVQPDLLFVRRDRLGLVRSDCVRGAPDLVVEALSPSNRAQDLVKKAVLYGLYEIPEYWVVDPESNIITVNVWRDGQYVALEDEDNDGTARSIVIPGFSVRPSDLFELPAWMTAAQDETE